MWHARRHRRKENVPSVHLTGQRNFANQVLALPQIFFFLGSFPNQSNKSVLLFFGEERLNNIHLYSPTWAHSRNILASAINNGLSMLHAACHRAISSCSRKTETRTKKNVHKYTILAHWFLLGICSGLQWLHLWWPKIWGSLPHTTISSHGTVEHCCHQACIMMDFRSHFPIQL